VESGQREAGLLDVRAGDDAAEAVAARQQFERQPERIRTAGEELTNGDRRR
jgi:hypothetical protein